MTNFGNHEHNLDENSASGLPSSASSTSKNSQGSINSRNSKDAPEFRVIPAPRELLAMERHKDLLKYLSLNPKLLSCGFTITPPVLRQSKTKKSRPHKATKISQDQVSVFSLTTLLVFHSPLSMTELLMALKQLPSLGYDFSAKTMVGGKMYHGDWQALFCGQEIAASLPPGSVPHNLSLCQIPKSSFWQPSANNFLFWLLHDVLERQPHLAGASMAFLQKVQQESKVLELSPTLDQFTKDKLNLQLAVKHQLLLNTEWFIQKAGKSLTSMAHEHHQKQKLQKMQKMQGLVNKLVVGGKQAQAVPVLQNALQKNKI